MAVNKNFSPEIASSDYEKVKEIFSLALDLAPFERAAFLDENCAGDANVRGEVESLLEAHGEAENFLNEVSAVQVVQDSYQNSNRLIGQKIDKYRIKKEIGRGGMGVVFLAEREDFHHQQAALKIIKRGMDSDAILERFAREREILAALNHPFIARLSDGGTTADGTPFFAMEYVEGAALDEYCENNNLTEKEKLELFRKICAAVSFAHQKLVVHRDLKPSNILVTADGTPKLLDFGIAKLLTAGDAGETQTHQQILTPAYASPEQIRGETVSTATDVYSLGLILWKILERKNSGETGREKKPAGDLQAILLTASHEDPARRYGSAENLSEDLRRYLEGLPISARKDTFGYRTGKFLKRNRVGVTALTTIFLLLVGGILLVSRQAKIAERERAKAERRAENLRKLSSSFAIELHDAILNLPGSLAARQLLLTRAVEQLDTLAAESDGNPGLEDELAQGYYNLSELPNINLADVERNTNKGIAIYQKLLAADSKNIAYRKQLAKGYALQSNVQKVRGDTSGALVLLQKSMTILEAVAADEPEVFEHKNMLREVEGSLATILMMMGRAQEALELSRKSRVLGEELVRLGKINDDFERMFAVLHFDECKSLIYLGDYQNSLELLRADYQIVSEQSAMHPNDTRFQYELWAYNRNLSTVLERTGNKKAALESLQTAFGLIENLLKMSPEDVGYQRNTSFTHLALGQFWVRQSRAEKALPHLRDSLEISGKIFAVDSQKGETLEDLARIHSVLGQALILLKKEPEGLRHLRESLVFFQKGLAQDPENALFRRDFAEALEQTGGALRKGLNPSDRDEAKAFYAQSLQIWQDLQNKGILSYTDAEQPKLAAQNLAQFNMNFSKETLSMTERRENFR
ncbi:MAG TPA: protein kinase [Pyrinomonadaceae bacterium]|nr:protein kinase [Pyrinomonadaceae bacterium]